MKFFSHGENTSLKEHLSEVCEAAECLEERIICACHDIGKATSAWQEYIRSSNNPESPHNHSATGGLLASLVIKQLERENSALWSAVALHVGSAHHSNLSSISGSHSFECCKIASDSQVKKFFLDTEHGVASLLLDIPAEKLECAWRELERVAPGGSKTAAFQKGLRLDGTGRMRAFLLSRSLLGRLCYQDHVSAAKQSGRTTVITHWKKAFPVGKFQRRTPKTFSCSTGRISELRESLRSKFLECMEYDSVFYLLDAPTGLGKTEAMLRGAETLAGKHGMSRIVFSVPQVSVADQIYEEYFDKHCDNAQIWNFIRQEKTLASGPDKHENESDNSSPSIGMDIALQPFSESYNITTFNQVLLAMCHPLRTRCVRGIGLKDAVIIMDEFHKLPLPILPFFFRVASEYARMHNCRFILGSATPLEDFEYLGLDGSRRIPNAESAPVYTDNAIDERRLYVKKGLLNQESLADAIDEFHGKSSKNLLVVVNLISKGSWPLLKHFHGSYDPWKQLEALNSSNSSRQVVFLDGLVPPMLRRQIVLSCKKHMKMRPVTLITTQMVEVGVDLDFDHGLIDYQGLASTIQRGGRIGREGRMGGPCTVEVFCLQDEDMQSSFEILNNVQMKNDSRFKSSAFDDIASKMEDFTRKEMEMFETWSSEAPMKDTQLVGKLLEIQSSLFMQRSPQDLLEKLFHFSSASNELGYDFLAGQYLSELYDSNYGTDAIVLKDMEELEAFSLLINELRKGTMSQVHKKELNRFVVDRKISVSDRRIIDETELLKCGCIKEFDESLLLVRNSAIC
ncbi:MAG TPA: CRISPR-associated endonuclease Cas3'' [Lentisphaeria bacterium]|nr:MAG: CRISPR-associated endonuclease Cas3'' [Lentisphaerae bacterium GWF2_50_93]HCE42875.1 CRISPR-associated endonuclease Cas3'' [Lentisphaeria bacterium]